MARCEIVKQIHYAKYFLRRYAKVMRCFCVHFIWCIQVPAACSILVLYLKIYLSLIAIFGMVCHSPSSNWTAQLQSTVNVSCYGREELYHSKKMSRKLTKNCNAVACVQQNIQACKVTLGMPKMYIADLFSMGLTKPRSCYLIPKKQQAVEYSYKRTLGRPLVCCTYHGDGMTHCEKS